MRFLSNILFLLYIINECFNLEKPKLFRCGFNDEKDKPIYLKGYKPINKTNNLFKRRLDPDGFKDFQIYLDVKNVERDIRIYALDDYHDLLINSMKKAVETLQALLRVKPLTAEYYFYDNQIEEDLKIKEWDKNIVGTTATLSGKTMASLDIDLIIFGTIETLSSGTLASASARFTDPDNGQPVIGIVKINKEVDYSKEKSQEYFQAIVLHEFTHILGFNIQNFEEWYHNVITKEDDFGIMRTYIISSKVVEVAKKYYNCPDLDGVELEESGGEGTAGSHWEARILLGDYMNGYAYTEEMVVSEFTLAALEDSGYYKANYFTGGLMRYGKNKGCEFVRGKCLNKDTHKVNNPLFYNEYYDTINSGNIDPSCTAGRQSRTYNAIWQYSDIPEEYQYFGDDIQGGYSPADYCPVPQKYSEEEEKVYFSGQCSIKGSGEYGSKITYASSYISSLSKNMLAVTGETLSDHSFCFLSSLTKNTLQISNVYSRVVRAVCYEIFCSSQSLTVKILEDYIVCPREGGKIIVDGYEGYFLCPDYYLMCSGTVICNDIFDCVDKKSETKESSYLYDYIPKTSQNIFESKDLDPDQDNNYELSEDGVCPYKCKQCKEPNKCSKCIEGFSLEGIISEDKIICTNTSELTDGYHIDENNVYYKCIQNCELCSDITGCDKCMRGYVLSNNVCITQEKMISNCYEYDINQTCIKCTKEYGFIGNDRTNCINLENLLGYYTQDEGVSYYPCQDINPNCSRCYYNKEDDLVKCYLCKNDLILINEEGGICYNKSILDDKTKYVTINKTHGEICSKAIPDCDECESSIKCKKCKDGYYFNNYEIKCLVKEEVIINYPEIQQKDETDAKNDNDNNNERFLNMKKFIKIQIVFLLILL